VVGNTAEVEERQTVVEAHNQEKKFCGKKLPRKRYPSTGPTKNASKEGGKEEGPYSTLEEVAQGLEHGIRNKRRVFVHLIAQFPAVFSRLLRKKVGKGREVVEKDKSGKNTMALGVLPHSQCDQLRRNAKKTGIARDEISGGK